MGVGKKKVLGGREVVKVAIVQKASRFLDKEASLTRAEAYIAEAATGGAQLIVFPEVWLAGYPYWTEGWDSSLQAWVGGRVAFRDAAVLAPSEDTERLGARARRANAYVVMGCNEIDRRPEVSTIYNSLLFFDPEGRLMGRHRKTMPTFSERLFWGQGDAGDLRVFETDIGRLGGLICGEHIMPLMRATMIGLGEDIHIAVFPGAFALHTGPELEEWDGDHSSFWGHSSVRAHAMEAGAFVLSACGIIDECGIPGEFPQGQNEHPLRAWRKLHHRAAWRSVGTSGRGSANRPWRTAGLDDQGRQIDRRHGWALRPPRQRPPRGEQPRARPRIARGIS